MTMEHIPRSFAVSLIITHPTLDPDEISEATGLVPHRTTRAGAARTTSKGDVLKGTYAFSCWTHQIDVTGATELASVLQDLVGQLSINESFFHRVVREGGAIELFCGVLAGGNWDEALSHALMGRLSTLQIDLRLDVYPRDSSQGATGKLTTGK